MQGPEWQCSTHCAAAPAPQTHCAAAPAPQTHCAAAPAPQTHCAAATAPQTHCAAATAPQTHCAAAPAPQTHCAAAPAAGIPLCCTYSVWSTPCIKPTLRSAMPCLECAAPLAGQGNAACTHPLLAAQAAQLAAAFIGNVLLQAPNAVRQPELGAWDDVLAVSTGRGTLCQATQVWGVGRCAGGHPLVALWEGCSAGRAHRPTVQCVEGRMKGAHLCHFCGIVDFAGVRTSRGWPDISGGWICRCKHGA